MLCHCQQKRTLLRGWLPTTFRLSSVPRFCQMAIAALPLSLFTSFAFSLSLHDRRGIGEHTRNVFGRIRDMYFDTRLGGYYLLVAYGIRVVAILLARRRPESDWARIQRDANFPADVIPAKLKERVIRWKDRWYTREPMRFYII